jgi:hypothetical protein
MLFKKNKFPFNIYIVFEKLKPIIYTNQLLTKNHFICLIPTNYYKNINIFLKNELFSDLSFLVDSSIIDLLKYNNNILFLKNKKKKIKYNLYYLYKLKTRLTFIQLLDNNSTNTIDAVYQNAS